MLLGLEYKASDRVLIASHFDEHHRVNFIIKPLKPADAFIWRPSRSVTDFKSWDGKFLKKEPSIRWLGSAIRIEIYCIPSLSSMIIKPFSRQKRTLSFMTPT